MAFIVEERPKEWAAVIGQDRQIEFVKGILTKNRYSPRGFILWGNHGVGKTTTGKLLARALMCSASPLGCGKCPSCLTFNFDGSDSHPDFIEVDAASHSGVADSRQILENISNVAVIGKTRVVLLDEAHRLSREAWDVYLKPLELRDSHMVFLFSTTDFTRIPKTIQSRCCKIHFTQPDTEQVVGLLCSLANKHNIPYEMAGIRMIAQGTQGHIRDAVNLLDAVGSLGKVTPDIVSAYVDTNTTTLALKTLEAVTRGDLKKACEHVDTLAGMIPPAKAIEKLFTCFGKSLFGAPALTTEEAKLQEAIRQGFPSPHTTTGVFLRWLQACSIPLDVLPLLLLEIEQSKTPAPQAPTLVMPCFTPPKETSTPAPSSDSIDWTSHWKRGGITPNNLKAFIGTIIVGDVEK